MCLAELVLGYRFEVQVALAVTDALQCTHHAEVYRSLPQNFSGVAAKGALGDGGEGGGRGQCTQRYG